LEDISERLAISDQQRINALIRANAGTLDRCATSVSSLSQVLVECERLYREAEATVVGRLSANHPSNGASADSPYHTSGSSRSFEPENSKQSRSDGKQDFIKAWLTAEEKGNDGIKKDGAGLAGAFHDLKKSWNEFFSGKWDYGVESAYFDLGKNLLGFWKQIYDTAADKFSLENAFGTGIFSKTGQVTVGGIGALGSLFGVGSDIYKLLNTDYQSGWEATGDLISTLTSSGGETTKDIYETYRLAKYGKEASTGPYSPAGLWLTFAETVTSAGGQAFKSIGKYSADGNWDMKDTGRTGIEIGVSGLWAMINGLSFGIVENVTGATADSISQGLEDWATGVGKNLGNWCVENNCTWILGKW
jgi:hypothetical protein